MSAGCIGQPAMSGTGGYSPAEEYVAGRTAAFLVVLGLLFLLDFATTQVILWLGGIELNPFMIGIVASPALHLGIKAVVLLLILAVSLEAERRLEGSSVVFYSILILLYTGIVLNNILVIVPFVAG